MLLKTVLLKTVLPRAVVLGHRLGLGPLSRETPPGRPRRAPLRVPGDPNAGAATAEYVIATMAAVGFAGLLIVILRGDEVRAILTELVRNALTVG